MNLILVPLVMATLLRPTEPPSETALWLARSCIGEAGWDAAERGECAAIWHVYHRRSQLLGWPLLRVVKRYSAAVKPGSHSRPWVRALTRDGAKPRGWDRRMKWGRYRDRWYQTLALADLFVAGRVADPLPAAGHYGGPMDRGLNPRVWVRIDTGGRFANWFYRRRDHE
jgi:hypothetical protein